MQPDRIRYQKIPVIIFCITKNYKYSAPLTAKSGQGGRLRLKTSNTKNRLMDFATLRLPVGAVRTKEPSVASPAPRKKTPYGVSSWSR